MTTSPISSWQTFRGMRHNAPMRRALPFLIVLSALGLAGCNSKSSSAQLVPRRTKHYKSVISLSPGTSEIIFSDADTSILKGRTSADTWPDNMAQQVDVVADVKPDYEKIQSKKPDLIVYDKALYSPDDVAKLKATGADLFSIDANTVDDFISQLQGLGSYLASEMRFNDYINRIYTEEHAAMGVKLNPVPKVAVLMPGKSGNDYIVGTDSFIADVIKISGGETVGPKGSIFVPLNAESLVSMNPDVIIVNGTAKDVSGAISVLQDPRFATINAIKQKRVVPIDSDVLLRRGQRVDQLIKAVHKSIAPPAK